MLTIIIIFTIRHSYSQPQLSYTIVATHSEGQVVNIHWQEPDNADSYDLDHYLVIVHPGNRLYKTKDTKISDDFNEGTYIQ